MMRLLSEGSTLFRSNHKFLKGTARVGVFNGWYFVQILSNLSMLQSDLIQKKCKVTFSTVNQIENGWHMINLDKNQALCLKATGNFNLQKYYHKRTSSKNTYNDYIISASENFQMDKYNYSKLSKNIYIVKNVSANQLKNDKTIFKFYRFKNPVLHNRYTAEYVLSGKEDGNYWDHPRYVKGSLMDGTGQIVTVTDSGIDPYNPFFYDPAIPLIVNQTNVLHRKIVRFDALTNFTDNYNGHGTHVAGTIAGKMINSNVYPSLYNGIAPEAKLYIIGIIDSSRNLNFQNYDLDIITKRAYELNSFIMSNSWGFLEDHKLMTESYDSHSYENQEMINIFSSGNSREISSPSDSKNVISVSATSHTSLSQVESRPLRVYSIQSSSYSINVTRFYWSKDPLEDEKESLDNRIDRIFITDDPEDYERPNTFLLIKKKFNCQNLMPENFRGYLVPSEITCRIPTHPVFLYKKSDLKKLLETTAATMTVLPSSFRPITVSKSTGGGITKTGIIKPDLAAPGESITSARAGLPEVEEVRNITRVLSTKTGTSMAVPTISGCAALIRQFFIDRFRVNPSGHLTKGLLILSARPLHKKTLDDFAGFGIPVVGDISTKPLVFADRKPIMPETNQTYVIHTTNRSKLSFVLSYFDPPSKGRRPLTADLDLFVITPNGFTMRANDQPSGDSFATTEKIIIENAEPGEYIISIVSGRFSSSEAVNYSIAASGELKEDGAIDTLSITPLQQCRSDLKTGLACETDIKLVYSGFKTAEAFHSKEVKFFKLSNIERINIRAQQRSTVHFCTTKQKPLRISDFDASCDYTNRTVSLKVPDCYLMVYTVTLEPVRVGLEFVQRRNIMGGEVEKMGMNGIDTMDIMCGVVLALMSVVLFMRICCTKHRKRRTKRSHGRRRSGSGSSLLNSYSSYSNPLSISSDEEDVFLAPSSSLP